MIRYLVAYAVTVVIFFALDFTWLGFVASGLYKAKMGDLLAARPNIPVAVVFYLLYVVGLVIFGEMRAFETGQWAQALLFGALFGFFAYATYDLTNLAVLRGYPASIAVIDMAWGTVLSGVCATAGYLVTGLIVRG